MKRERPREASRGRGVIASARSDETAQSARVVRAHRALPSRQLADRYPPTVSSLSVEQVGDSHPHLCSASPCGENGSALAAEWSRDERTSAGRSPIRAPTHLVRSLGPLRLASPVRGVHRAQLAHRGDRAVAIGFLDRIQRQQFLMRQLQRSPVRLAAKVDAANL